MTRAEMSRSALLSEDERLRYVLWRRWADIGSNGSEEPLCFIMLNPSTADANIDDPTIRRCVNFAKREGFPAISVINLTSVRSTKPRALLKMRGDIVAAVLPEGIHLPISLPVCRSDQILRGSSRLNHCPVEIQAMYRKVKGEGFLSNIVNKMARNHRREAMGLEPEGES